MNEEWNWMGASTELTRHDRDRYKRERDQLMARMQQAEAALVELQDLALNVGSDEVGTQLRFKIQSIYVKLRFGG